MVDSVKPVLIKPETKRRKSQLLGDKLYMYYCELLLYKSISHLSLKLHIKNLIWREHDKKITDK